MTFDQNPQAIADAYLGAWNEPDLSARKSGLERGWTATARYQDPIMKGSTPEGIANMIEAARAQAPGYTFKLRGTPDGHGRLVRFSWDLQSANGATAAAGTDIVRLDDLGLIEEVLGFLD